MHAWVVYRREVMRTPLRTLADEIGISKSAVDRFHQLRSHPGKNWPKLRDWYMRTHATRRHEYQTPPELMVASAMQLLSAVPSESRASAMQATVEHYKQIYAGLPHQEWIQMLAELADEESQA